MSNRIRVSLWSWFQTAVVCLVVWGASALFAVLFVEWLHAHPTGYLTVMQWAACVLSISGAYLTALRSIRPRFVGFALFLVSNLIMTAWSAATGNWGLLTMYTVFTGLSILGLWNHRTKDLA